MSKPILKPSLLATSAAIALGCGAASAHAQDAAPAGPAAPDSGIRIVVTAQTVEQDLIEVPINIAVASQEQLDLLGTDDIEQYADFVPGLQVQAQSLNTSSYSLRGVTSDGGRPRVAVFENGVSIGAPRFGANTAMFDLERIEVVKGPQATLFGQGALVGGINLLQNRASLSGTEGYAKLDGGEYDYLRFEMGRNLALTDTMAVRFAGLVKNRKGYVDNVANSPDLMGQDTTALRAAFAWEPTDTLRFDVWANRQEDDSTGTQFKSGVFPATGGDTNPFTFTSNNITPEQERDRLGADRELNSLTARAVWDVTDDWTLTSISAHRYLENREAFDSDGAAFSLLQFTSWDKGHVWSQELRANFDNGGPVSGFVGASYYTQDVSTRLRLVTDEARAQAFLAPQIVAGVNAQLPAGAPPFTVASLEATLAGLGVAGAANFDNVVTPLPVSAILLLTQRRVVPLAGRHVEESSDTGEQTSKDIFADLTWEITDRLSVTGGLRYTWDELYSDHLAYLVQGNAALGGVRNGVTGGTTLVSPDTLGVPDARSYDTDGELTWRFNAAYRLSDNLNTWLAVGRGRRPPSLSSNSAEPTGYEVVDQETYDNVEIGLAGQFLDGRLVATTSAYYGQYKDFQTTRYDVSQGSFVTENSGNATSWGFEFDGRFEAADWLNLFATYAHTFSEYDDEDDDGNALEFAGNRFRLTPENSFSIAADVHLPVGAEGEVYFVPSYTWKDDVFFEDDNDPWEFQDAYGLLNLKLGYEHNGGDWGVSLYVENALDEEYLIDAGNTGGDFGIPTYIRGAPRMIGAGVQLRY